MTDAKQTKCPHCGSTFRISDSQLAAKGGSVRCGSCLQVFRADLHLLGASPAPAPSATPAALDTQASLKPKQKKNAGDESWALALIDEKADPSEPATHTNLYADDQPNHADTGADFADEFSFQANTDDDFINPSASGTGKPIRFDDELSDMLDDVGDNDSHLPSSTSHHSTENADESWAQNILSELEDSEKQADSKKYSLEILDSKSKAPPKNARMAAALGLGAAIEDEPSPTTAKAPAGARPSDDFLADDLDVLSFLDADDLGSAAAPAPSANPFSLERPLAHVDAPVTLKPQREPINWGHIITWSVLSLMALAMFITQYIYFNFNTLAIQPTIRPYFEQACAQFGCRLPDIPDPSKLKIEELMVRKHANIEGALQVDALLKNGASFPQPFPALQLRFSNGADEVIASRILKPVDYLLGDAKLMRRMPPDTPIRISLEIVDPGKTAISYSLTPVQ